MGRMRFVAPGQEAALAQGASRGYLAGLEGIPWETRCTLAGDVLNVDRETFESGCFSFPWRDKTRGELMLSTSNLMEREATYMLPLELARGTVNRLRQQASAWQQSGLRITPALDTLIRNATQAVGQAAISASSKEDSAQFASEAIRLALDAVEQLGAEYSLQALTIRRDASPLTTLLACRLDEAPQPRAGQRLAEAFNSVVAPFNWRVIETKSGTRNWEKTDALIDWAKEQNFRVCGGPLILLNKRSLPDWLYLWEDDWDELAGNILDHVRSVVTRYKGRVQLWNVAGRVNVDPDLGVDEEQMLRLTVDAIELVRSLDPRTPIIVSFDQPWSEHLGQKDRDLPPMHFADTLARAELGVAGFGLEINWGYWPQATPARDCLELSRLLDRWSMLGLPLMVSFTAPSGGTADPNARNSIAPIIDQELAIPSPVWQKRVVDQVFPLLLAKNSVQAIAWTQWTDTEPHEFAHGGLIDIAGKAKPALKTLAELRKKYLP